MPGPARGAEAPAEVSLVFPPLVTTNFGRYYPSTAILSGYLADQGFPCEQVDLNEELALYLLRPEQLERWGEGDPPGGRRLSRESMPAVAARVLARNPGALLDDRGRHLFQEQQHPLAHLLTRIAEVLRVDFASEELARGDYFDAPLLGFYDRFYEETGYAERLAPTVHTVGVSVPLGPQLVPALVLARHVKRRRPDVEVVLGGPTVSLMAGEDLDRLLRHEPAVGAVIRYEGEPGFLALLEQRRRGEWRPREVPGASSLHDGEPVHCPPGPGPDLDALPFADYDPRLLGRLADPEIGIIQARGCYWGRCAYCDYVELYEGSPRYRTKKVERFVAEMRHQVETHGVRKFAIITESLPSAFARRMSRQILETGLDVSWESFAMVEKHFTRELFELMVEAGCRQLEIGVESMTDRVLMLVEKLGTKSENLRFLREAAEAGIRLKINLIPDLPSTTFEEGVESLDNFKSIRDCLNLIGVYPFEPTKSSRIGREPERFSLRVLTDAELDGQSEFPANHLSSVDPAMTDEERRRLHAMFFAFREEVNGRRGRSALGAAPGDDDLLGVDGAHVDFTPYGTSLLVYNALSRESWNLGWQWWKLLAEIASEGPLRRFEIVRRLGPGGETLCDLLVERGCLVPWSDQARPRNGAAAVPPPPPAPGAGSEWHPGHLDGAHAAFERLDSRESRALRKRFGDAIPPAPPA